MIVGYVRVSTDGQTLDAQQAALRDAGATQIYSEKISGAATERKALAKALAALAERDCLNVRIPLTQPGPSPSACREVCRYLPNRYQVSGMLRQPQR